MPDTSVQHRDTIEQQARAALEQLIATHRLPAPRWTHLYGLRPGAPVQWLDVQLSSTWDAHSWAAALGTRPEAEAWLDSAGLLRCRVHVARRMTIPGCPVPVEVGYSLDADEIQAVAL